MRDIIRLGQVETVRKRLNEATQSLLGDTIVLSDAEWQQPSLLPGWSRAHVATHLARGADALSHVVRNTASGRMVPLYANEGQRLADIERGSERSGLELQIDLDTAAGALEEAFAEVVDWLVPVTLPIGSIRWPRSRSRGCTRCACTTSTSTPASPVTSSTLCRRAGCCSGRAIDWQRARTCRPWTCAARPGSANPSGAWVNDAR